MIVIGLTGGIATGKSTVARFFVEQGAALFNADEAVHALMQPQGAAYEAVIAAFPGAYGEGRIDRKALGEEVFADTGKLAQLEAILHPLVRQAEEAFIATHRTAGTPYVVLEVPLLFEKGMDALCDVTVTTECPPDVQYERAMARAGMTKEKYLGIIATQMKQEARRERADWVIPTGMNEQETKEAVAVFLRTIRP